MQKNVLTAFVLGFALAAVAAVQAPARAGDPGTCAVYAGTAVNQQKKNKAMGCGFSGLRWSKNYAGHYAWCIGAPYPAIQGETNARAAMLGACGGGNQGAVTFWKPKVAGLRLDWCYKWASLCGQPAAKAFCASKGFSEVKGFDKADDVGKTRVIGTGQVCSAPGCDGFKYVKCGP